MANSQEIIDLPNKPLVETWIEVKWALQKDNADRLTDPDYKFLLGRLFDNISDTFPFHEQLPTASVPDEMVAHIVQHRFRKEKDSWPIIQVGPGIFSFNETDGYLWHSFRENANWAIQRLFKSFPKQQKPKITSVFLKYVDAISHDPDTEELFHFLREKLKISVSFPDQLYNNLPIERNPKTLNWHISFATTRPIGRLNLRFATGKVNREQGQQPALIWETTVQSADHDVPELPTNFESWLDQAHEITHEVFFTLIEGELRRRFEGE